MKTKSRKKLKRCCAHCGRLFVVNPRTVHVWRLLGRMGFSPQRPAGRARERNEEAIAEWKSRQWPRLKKKP